MSELNAWENTTPKDQFNTSVCSKLFPILVCNVDLGYSSTTLSFLKTPYLVDIKDILKISNYTLCFSEQLSLHFLYHEENLNHPIKLSFCIAAKIRF